MNKQNNIPEAVASVTYSVTSKDGYNALFTVRGEKGMELLEMMKTIEKKLDENGYTPQVKKSWGKQEAEVVPDRKCPTCGSDLVYFMAKGKKHIKCSKQTWNRQTNSKEGCPFTEWSD